MRVTLSPTFRRVSASSNSIRIWLVRQSGRTPSCLLSLFISTVTASGSADTLRIVKRHAFASDTAEYLGQIGSIIRLFMAHIFYHSIRFALLLGPCSSMNSISVSTLIPFLRHPLSVGNRGSSHPSTLCSSTNQVNFLFDKTVYSKFKREYS